MPRLAIYVLVCLTAAVAGCVRPGPAPRVWAADDMVHLTERTRPAFSQVWDADHRTVRLFSACNETVSFQLVIDAADGAVGNVTVRMDPPADASGQGLGDATVTVHRMLPVTIRRFPAWYLRLAEEAVAPGAFYDALCPIDAPKVGQPFGISPGGRIALWVDVSVPRDAAGGEYAGKVSVAHRFGQVDTDVKLKVYDFVLPDARPVVCAGGFDNRDLFRHFVRRPDNEGRDRPFVPVRLNTDDPHVTEGLTVLRQLMVLAHRHRVDLFDKGLHPILKRDRDGKIELLWEDYDLIARPYLDGTAFDDRIGVGLWPAPLGPDWPRPDDYGGRTSQVYRQTFADVVALAARHLAELNAAKRAFYWPRLEAAGPEAYLRQAELARLIRQASPEATILCELPPSPPPESNWRAPEDLVSLTDMWAPPANLVALSWAHNLPREAKPLAGLWLRPGRPPYLGSCGVLGSPADIRALPWLAMKYRCAGIFLPETLNWPDILSGEAPSPMAATAPAREDAGGGELWQFDPDRAAEGSEDRLFYPGASFGLKEVLPSVRLKRLRRGLQDVAYLHLLNQRDRQAVAEAMIGTMVRYGALDAAGDHYLDPRLDGWVGRGDLWIAARRLLAEEVADAVSPEPAGRKNLLATRLAWLKLTAEAAIVRVERVRTVVEPAGEGYRAVIRVDLFNELGRAAEVDLAVAETPPGWTAPAGVARQRLGPLERRTVELALAGDQVPTGSDARMPIPVTIATNRADTRTFLAEAPFLLAGFAPKGPTIDGDPKDWTLRPANTAAGFRLLGRRGRVGNGQAVRQTQTFVLRDEQNLYLLFRCEDPQPESVRARPDNTVRYEQLIAGGEDLVEALFDPGRRAKGAEDLYHLVVKANGVAITERGVSCDPPLGQVRPWPVNLKVAVGRAEKAWIVELAIPLSAFGEAGAEPYWGVNFTRFATAGAEASSWSGPPRYFYHPANLGTMVLLGENDRPKITHLLVTDPAGGGVMHW